jgi:hypothetical protein
MSPSQQRSTIKRQRIQPLGGKRFVVSDYSERGRSSKDACNFIKKASSFESTVTTAEFRETGYRRQRAPTKTTPFQQQKSRAHYERGFPVKDST